MESIDQLVYVCQADSSSTVRRKAKEALFSMGQSGTQNMALTLSEHGMTLSEHGTDTVRDQNMALTLSEIRTWQRSEHVTNTVRDQNMALTLSESEKNIKVTPSESFSETCVVYMCCG